MDIGILIGGIITAVIFCVSAIAMLRWAYISSTEGATARLNEEIAKASAKQAELNMKIKKADEELEKRREEAKQLIEKMRAQAEEELKAEREKIIGKARQESEEIIAKAQNAKEKMKIELEKEFDIRLIDYAGQILNAVLNEKAVKSLGETLNEDFLLSLEGVDMSRITADVKSVDLITLKSVDANFKGRLETILKKKLGRDLAVNASVDPEIGGGAILKFGSMALDGSLHNAIREKCVKLKEAVDLRQTVKQN